MTHIQVPLIRREENTKGQHYQANSLRLFPLKLEFTAKAYDINLLRLPSLTRQTILKFWLFNFLGVAGVSVQSLINSGCCNLKEGSKGL
jgi:hypothetical protein